MAGAIQRLNLTVAKTPITIYLSKNWASPAGSKSREIRKKNREALAAFLEKMVQSKIRRQKKRLDLSPLFFTSISHTEKIGGFAIAHGPVGLDIEAEGRKVSDSAARRTGTSAEIEIAGGPLALWVLKEAAWKSTRGFDQPKVISQIQIFSHPSQVSKRGEVFFRLSSKITSSRKFNPPLGKVRIILNSRHILGISTFFP